MRTRFANIILRIIEDLTDGLLILGPTGEIVFFNEMLLKNTVEEYRMCIPALEELETKYGVTVVDVPDDILVKQMEAWEKVSKKLSDENPMFAKVLESQRKWAEQQVPFRRKFFKDYSFAADWYWEK